MQGSCREVTFAADLETYQTANPEKNLQYFNDMCELFPITLGTF